MTPINYCDPSGNFAIATLIILGLIAAGATAGGVYSYNKAYDAGYRGWDLAAWTMFGTAVGGFVGFTAGYFAAPLLAGLFTSGGALALAGGGVLGTGLLLGTAATLATGVLVVGGSIALNDTLMMFANQTRKSGKQKASDKPDWVNQGMVDKNLSAEENARKILDSKYGRGNWKQGPGTEYSKIKKWLQRALGLR